VIFYAFKMFKKQSLSSNSISRYYELLLLRIDIILANLIIMSLIMFVCIVIMKCED
jgi:hypothetical protein